MNLDDCDRIIEEAINCVTEEAFCHAVAPLFDHYQILSVDWGRGSIFWRARIIENEPFKSLREMNYPPSRLAKIGRLNDEGSPCFYVAARKETAIAEVDAKEGQLIQLAGFRVMDFKPIRLLLLGEYSNIQKFGYMQFAGVDPEMALSKILNAMPRGEALKKIYIDKFFAHILTNPNANNINYLTSRALAKSFFARSKADGIVFPSVKDRGGFNLGIKPGPSDVCLHNVCCIVVKIGKQRRFGFTDFDIVKSAKMLDPKLNFVWDGSLTGEVIGMYGMNKVEHDLVKNSPNDRNSMLNMLHRNRTRHTS